MSEEASNLKVGVRVRPMSRKELAGGSGEVVRVVGGKTISIAEAGKEDRNFSFDHAFESGSTQAAVYKAMAAQLCGDVCLGKNATVFAYGATGSGKTHTMLGTPDDPGVMIRTLEGLFSLANSPDYADAFDFKVRVSFMEIYNENVRDLLLENASKSKGLEIREDKKGAVYVEGVTEIETHTAEEVIQVLHTGNKRRTTESTNANLTSSRSHAVLQIQVQRFTKIGALDRTAKLSLIDLAGSEKSSATEGVGKSRQVEGANINKSLLALANCINKLGQAKKEGKDQKSFVNYRDSKLTRLLKESLGGNCKTVMIAAISPSDASVEETLSTLKYANRAKNIKTHVVENRLGDSGLSELEGVIAELRAEVASLRQRISSCEQGLEPEMTVEDIMVEMRSNAKVVNVAHPDRLYKSEVISALKERSQVRRLQDEVVEQNRRNMINLKQKLVQLDAAMGQRIPLRDLDHAQASELTDLSMDIDDIREGMLENLQISQMLQSDLQRRHDDLSGSMERGEKQLGEHVARFTRIGQFAHHLEAEITTLRVQMELQDSLILDFFAVLEKNNALGGLDDDLVQVLRQRFSHKVRVPMEAHVDDEAGDLPLWRLQQTVFTPVHASALQQSCIAAHQREVLCCNFSCDGQYLASCGNDLVVRVHRVRDGAEMASFEGHSEFVNSCCFSPDGSLVMSAGDDGVIKLWAFGGEDESLGEVGELVGHGGPVFMASFSPDGAQILSCSFDETLILWEAGNPEPVRVLEGHEGFVYSCDFSPTHQTCVSASEDGTVRVWDLLSGEELLRLAGHNDMVYRAVFSSDGSMVCSASQDGTIRVWDLREGNEVGAFVGHGDAVRDCCLSTDGRFVVSSSADHTVRVWDCFTGTVVRHLEGHQSSVNSVAMSPNGMLVASGGDDKTLRIWQIDVPSAKKKAAPPKAPNKRGRK